MTQLEPRQPGVAGSDPERGHGGHRLMMIACCIPMLLIAIALVLTGVANGSVIFGALMCFVMMAGMGRGSDSK